MSSLNIFSVFLFSIIILLPSAYSLRCYTCDGSLFENCNDGHFDRDQLRNLNLIQECSIAEQQIPPPNVYKSQGIHVASCVKMTLPLTSALPVPAQTNKNVTIRSCFFGNPRNKKEHCQIERNRHANVDFQRIIDENCHICTDDLCNSSTAIIPLTSITSLSIIIIGCFFKFV